MNEKPKKQSIWTKKKTELTDSDEGVLTGLALMVLLIFIVLYVVYRAFIVPIPNP